MKKIPTLFKRNYDGDRLVCNEVVEGCEWVIKGEGIPTEKFDGTCCMVKNGILYKRYDRKDGKPEPPGWIEALPKETNEAGKTHWLGWALIGEGPEDKRHREAFKLLLQTWSGQLHRMDDTYELIGPKVQNNPYGLTHHVLWYHGLKTRTVNSDTYGNIPRNFDGLRSWFVQNEIEGVVWHHPDGRMCKIKRRDFGFPWPVK